MLAGKKIIDISTPLYQNMEVLPGLCGFVLEWELRIAEGDTRNRSRITMGTHLGTHVDAPRHFIEGGKTLDQMPQHRLIGRAQIIEVPYPLTVTGNFLKDKYENAEIVLFKFGKSRQNRLIDYFDPSGVSFLIGKGVNVIGTDNGNVDSKNTEWEIHRQILREEILIVEGLNLEAVDQGTFFFICLPLSINGSEGAPARALIIK